jgi:hypothetical protein
VLRSVCAYAFSAAAALLASNFTSSACWKIASLALFPPTTSTSSAAARRIEYTWIGGDTEEPVLFACPLQYSPWLDSIWMA